MELAFEIMAEQAVLGKANFFSIFNPWCLALLINQFGCIHYFMVLSINSSKTIIQFSKSLFGA